MGDGVGGPEVRPSLLIATFSSQRLADLETEELSGEAREDDRLNERFLVRGSSRRSPTRSSIGSRSLSATRSSPRRLRRGYDAEDSARIVRSS